MSEGGFFEQKRSSPAGFMLVVAAHAGALGAVMLIKGPIVIPPRFTPTEIFNVTPDTPPPEVRPELPETPVPPQQPTVIDLPRQVVPTQAASSSIDSTPVIPDLTWTPPGDVVVPPRPAEPPPVRRNAEIDPRYADALQPPYPASEQRAQRGGEVRVRVTIGADGRVRAVERLSATSDAFWAVVERQALRHWRFRPATVDGRPVESTKVMTLRFRIENA